MLESLKLHDAYQMGFVVRDVDQAVAHFRDAFGVEHFRILRHNADIATAHAYAGDMMIELVQVSSKGPAYFVPYIPKGDQVAQFHHNAYNVRSQEEWDALDKVIKSLGLPYWESHSMNGGMNVFFVDLTSQIGTFAEYVYRTGDALGYYDGVPRNERR